jgi:hypothetical protein
MPSDIIILYLGFTYTVAVIMQYTRKLPFNRGSIVHWLLSKELDPFAHVLIIS